MGASQRLNQTEFIKVRVKRPCRWGAQVPRCLWCRASLRPPELSPLPSKSRTPLFRQNSHPESFTPWTGMSLRSRKVWPSWDNASYIWRWLLQARPLFYMFIPLLSPPGHLATHLLGAWTWESGKRGFKSCLHRPVAMKKNYHNTWHTASSQTHIKSPSYLWTFGGHNVSVEIH